MARVGLPEHLLESLFADWEPGDIIGTCATTVSQHDKGLEFVRDSDTDRRQFLKNLGTTALGAAGFPYIVPSAVLGANAAVPPSEKEMTYLA